VLINIQVLRLDTTPLSRLSEHFNGNATLTEIVYELNNSSSSENDPTFLSASDVFDVLAKYPHIIVNRR
jgi:hypothetical protein